MVDCERVSLFSAIDAAIPVADQDIPFAEGDFSAVYTAHNLYQHKNCRGPEYLPDAMDDSVRILQDFDLFGKYKTHRFSPVNKTKKAVVTV